MTTARTQVMALLVSAVALASCQHAAVREAGFAGQQPRMDVRLTADSAAAADVPQVIAAAKAFFRPSEEYWPEPSTVVERESYWWVQFPRNDKLIVQGGTEWIAGSIPNVACIRVEKADLSCSVVPNR
jgi:hypothetical protein